MAVDPSNTHCHQLLPPTRAEVSSDPITGEARKALAIGSAAATRGASARADIRDRTFADRHAEDFVHHDDQTLETDRLGDVQMDDQGPKLRPEW